MNKSTRIVKKLLTLFLVVLMSINSFAAVVGDNDGAAFITKAEFESLRNDFQTQINRYNSSIDDKISGAIANYLEGVKVNFDPTNLWDAVTKSLGQSLRMRNKFDTGTSTTTTSVMLSFQRVLDIKEATNFNNGIYVSYNPGGSTTYTGLWRIETRVGTGTGTNVGSHFFSYTDFGGLSAGPWGYADGTKWVLYTAWATLDRTRRGATNVWNNDYSYSYSYAWRRYIGSNVAKTAGVGARWIYHQNPNGQKYLMNYNTRFGGAVTGQVIYKTVLPTNAWNINGKPGPSTAAVIPTMINYMSDNTRSDDTSQTIDAQLGTNDLKDGNVLLGKKSSDDGKAKSGGGTRDGKSMSEVSSAGSSTATDSLERDYYWELNYSTEQTSDGTDYTLDQWGKNTGTTLYTNRDIELPTKGSATNYTVARSEFNNVYASTGGWIKQTNYLGQLTIKLNPAAYGVTSLTANKFVNTYISAVAGETVYLGGGCPIVKVNDNDKDITIRGKFASVSGTGSNDDIKYFISNKQFKDGAVDTANGGLLLASGTVKLNTEWTKVVTTGMNDTIWINFYDNTTNGAVVTMSSLKATQ